MHGVLRVLWDVSIALRTGNEDRKFSVLSLKVGNRTIESVVGIDGEFYLENLPPGKHTGHLLSNGRMDMFVLEVPRSDETLVDLGDIDSEPAIAAPAAP